MKIVNSGVLQKLNTRNWADPCCTGNWEVTKYWSQIQLEIEDKLTSQFRDDDDYEMTLRPNERIVLLSRIQIKMLFVFRYLTEYEYKFH